MPLLLLRLVRLRHPLRLVRPLRPVRLVRPLRPVRLVRLLRPVRLVRLLRPLRLLVGGASLCLGVVGLPCVASAALAPLTVSGNHIIRDGVPFAFYGVNRDSLEWGEDNWGGCGGDGHFTAADWDAIAAWHVDAVRIPLSEADWLGRRCSPAAYKADVDAVVRAANARGMYVILDLHWSDVDGEAPCDAGCLSGQQPMPDPDSEVFWRQVASRYRNRPGVIFDLFNEPHGVPWPCWLGGGCSVESSTDDPSTGAPVTYTAVGMQKLYDVVRATGARNLVLVAGLDWAYDLSGIGEGYALRGENIAYDTHVYTAWHNTPADWYAHFGYLTATHPVTATEFGSTDCSTTATLPLLDYFSAPAGNAADPISWTIWSWNAPGSCSQPSLLADWSGDPLGGQGSLIKAALAYLAGDGGGAGLGLSRRGLSRRGRASSPAGARAGSGRRSRRARGAASRG